GRRVAEDPGTLRSLYYSLAWQVLEEDVSGAMQDQYAWSPVYVDAMIERDTPGQRLYVQQDANWNVTAILNTVGAVQERYVEDPYGQATALDPGTWASRVSSLFAWNYLHQGGRYDAATGLYGFRNRDYSPVLARWLQQDPFRFDAGETNLYRYANGSPVSVIDPDGL